MNSVKKDYRNAVSDKILILLVFVLILIFLNSCFRQFDRDELEAIHSAWKILKGERIYIDFFQHHHPFFYFMIVPFIQLFGEATHTIILLRTMMFLMFLGILVVVYNIAVEIFEDKKLGILSVLLLSTTVFFYDKAIEIRPDVPQTLFGMLAIYCFYVNSKSDKLRYTVLGSMALAISFLFLQKAVFLAISIMAIQLVRILKGYSKCRVLIIYWVIFLLTLLPYGLYILSNGMVTEYIRCDWIINMHFKNSFLPFDGLMSTFRDNTIIWTFYVLGIFFSRRYLAREICGLSILLFISLFCVRAPYEQYYMMFLPIMSIISAYGILCALDQKSAIVTIIIISTLLPIGYLISNLVLETNSMQMSEINFVLSNTGENDYVYDGDIQFNIFRKDIDYFWYSLFPEGALATYKSLYPYDYDIYKRIAKYKPKIISQYYIDPEKEIIRKNYYHSKKFKDIFVRIARRD